MTLPALPFAASFMHPLMMWGLLAAGGYSMFLGIKAKKVRTGTPEQRKALLPGKFAQRHYRWDWNDCLGCIIGSVHAAGQCDCS
jgi:hypothetical protein